MSHDLWRDRLGCFLPEYVEACQTRLVVRELEAGWRLGGNPHPKITESATHDGQLPLDFAG